MICRLCYMKRVYCILLLSLAFVVAVLGVEDIRIDEIHCLAVGCGGLLLGNTPTHYG
jgi:hypothetical protein